MSVSFTKWLFYTTIIPRQYIDDIKKAVKKDAAEKKLVGTIRIYLNVAQMAAYYTVNGQGNDDYKVEFVKIVK